LLLQPPVFPVKTNPPHTWKHTTPSTETAFFFFKQKTAYEISIPREPTEAAPVLIAPPPPEPVVPPAPPPPPPGPKVGDKIGFIQLPPKAGPRTADKVAPVKLPARPVEPKKTDFTKRGDIRGIRGVPTAPAGPAVPAARLP